MDGTPVVVPGKNSAHTPRDYSKESTEWVKDILMIQLAGLKDYIKKTFTDFAAKIINSVHAKIVLDHIAGAHAGSHPPTYRLYLQDC